MIKIACIGIAVQDKIYYVDKLPYISGKYISMNYKEFGGGPAATAAVAIAKLGGSVDFIGRVGDDPTGKSIISELEYYGVSTKYTKIYKNAQSSQSAILVDSQGERLIINYPSQDLLDETSWLEDIDLSQYDVILADVRWHEGTYYCFHKARSLGITTILDADTTPQPINLLVQLSTHAVFSEPGLKKLTNMSNIENALSIADKMASNNAYVTRGKKGCQWIQDSKIQTLDSFAVNVVDTTGAGDVFHGAFAYAIANHYETREAIEFSSAVAALKCTQYGGREGIPSLNQVNRFLERHKQLIS